MENLWFGSFGVFYGVWFGFFSPDIPPSHTPAPVEKGWNLTSSDSLLDGSIT